MDSYNSTLISNLKESVAILRAISVEGQANFEQALQLATFFKSHQRTNLLVDYAIGIIESNGNNDIERLTEETAVLKETAAEFCGIIRKAKPNLTP